MAQPLVQSLLWTTRERATQAAFHFSGLTLLLSVFEENEFLLHYLTLSAAIALYMFSDVIIRYVEQDVIVSLFKHKQYGFVVPFN